MEDKFNTTKHNFKTNITKLSNQRRRSIFLEALPTSHQTKDAKVKLLQFQLGELKLELQKRNTPQKPQNLQQHSSHPPPQQQSIHTLPTPSPNTLQQPQPLRKQKASLHKQAPPHPPHTVHQPHTLQQPQPPHHAPKQQPTPQQASLHKQPPPHTPHTQQPPPLTPHTIQQPHTTHQQPPPHTPQQEQPPIQQTLLLGRYPNNNKGYQIHKSDLDTIDNGRFLNDIVINVMLTWVGQEALPGINRDQVCICNTYWFEGVLRGSGATDRAVMRDNLNLMRKWYPGGNPFGMPMVVVPINHRLHWVGFIIIKMNNGFHIWSMDSLGEKVV